MERREGKSTKTRLDHLYTIFRIRWGKMLQNKRVKRFLKLKVEHDFIYFEWK